MIDEASWQESSDPDWMLASLGERVTDRKLRLFACACCRRVLHRLEGDTARQAIEAAEQWADGVLSSPELDAARTAKIRRSRLATDWAWQAIDVTRSSDRLRAVHAAWCVRMAVPNTGEEYAQCRLIRDIFNPFHKVRIDPRWTNWQGGAVVKMAQAIYESRSFSDLPILADALDEAGCTDETILSHCRGAGDHTRGCFVLDAILGRD
jgi:hypothetical protein